MSRRGGDLDLREAEHCAKKALAECEIQSLPIDPFAIAAQKGIVVAPEHLEGCSGCLVKSGDAFGILYSTSLKNEGFERFTVAHELGHYFLPGHPEALFSNGETTHRSRSGFVSRDPLERQADSFAASLLLPESLFLKTLRAERSEGFKTIKKLALLCRSSLTATALRFAQCSDDPVAVVMSMGQEVQWCEMSQSLRDIRGLTWLHKGSLLPRDTPSARFNTRASNVASAQQEEGCSDLSVWFDGAPSVEMMEDVVGLGSYERTLTVLFMQGSIDDGADADEND
jgi:hypothetical protein